MDANTQPDNAHDAAELTGAGKNDGFCSRKKTPADMVLQARNPVLHYELPSVLFMTWLASQYLRHTPYRHTNTAGNVMGTCN